MAIVIIGGGAIGLLVAGRLAQAGESVALLARPSTCQVLAANGLTIRTKGQALQIRQFPVATTPEELPANYQTPDLAILCVKGYDTAASIPTIQILQPKRVLTLQNGIGNEEVLAAALGNERVVAGAITSSVEPADAATIVVTKTGGIGLAPVVVPRDLAPIAAPLERAGFSVRHYPDHQTLKWSKALLNMLGNATAAILDMSVAEVYADKRLFALERCAFLEAFAVMQQIGAQPLDLPAYPVVLLTRAMRFLPMVLLQPLLRRMIAGGRGGKAPSLQRDLQAKRNRTEGAQLYGAIAARAATVGVHAPCNAGLWRVLEAIVHGTQSWDTFRKQPVKLLEAVG